MQENIGRKIRLKGWQQGTIVPASRLLKKLPDGSPVEDSDFAMIVSQSCDLVHHDLNQEPYAMILVLKSASSGSSEFMHGRNPRRLHFQTSENCWFEAQARNQTTISRKILATKEIGEEIKLSPVVLRIILEWLAKRFTRIAFPDDFNAALAPKSKALGKLLKKHHHLFSEILINVFPFTDLNQGERYQVACYLLMKAETHDNQDHLTEARAVADNLERLFEECNIIVEVCTTVSENDMSIAEFNQLLNWDYDHLTNRASSNT